MATADPKATLQGLIELQKLDSDVWRIRRRITEGPQLLARRSERLKQTDARLADAHEKVIDQKKQSASFELDVKTKEVEIQKIQAAQGQSRTNEEFRAFGEHVNRMRKETRALEDRILECLAAIEQIEHDSAELKKQRDALKAEADVDAEQWKKDEVSYQQDLAAIAQKRAEYVKTLPPGPVSIYERILKARDGKVVVPAEGRICGGCQMSITPNDLARLHRGNELIACRSCERILYVPELMGTAH